METTIERRAKGEGRAAVDVMIQLSSEIGIFEADGLNVSLGGLSMRSSQVPEVGSRMSCSFECPPTGEIIEVEGDVVWARTSGLAMGEFGLRFTAVSQTAERALRELVFSAVEETRDTDASSARILLDGMPSPIVGRIAHRDRDVITIEQELPFLRLGQSLSIAGQDGVLQRGLLGAIDLVVDDDMPRLVLQVLTTASAVDMIAPSESADTLMDVEAPVRDDELREARSEESMIGLSDDEDDALRAMTIGRTNHTTLGAAETVEGRRFAHNTSGAAADEANDTAIAEREEGRRASDELRERLVAMATIAKTNTTAFAKVARAALGAFAIVVATRSRAFWAAFSPKAAASMSAAWAKTSSFFASLFARTKIAYATWQSGREKVHARVTSPAPQQAQAPKRREQQRPRRAEVAAVPENKGFPMKPVLVTAGVVAGLGLAAYAIWGGEEPTTNVLAAPSENAAPASSAPVSASPSVELAPSPPNPAGAQLAQPAAAQPAQAIQTAAPVQIPMPTALPAPTYNAGQLPAPTYASLRDGARLPTPQAVPAGSPYAVDVRDPRIAGADPTLVAPAAQVAAAPQAESTTDTSRTLSFGAASVPNAQVFTFHMTQPITNVTGSSSRDGFAVQLVGGLSLDRAAPIKAALSFVEGAGIANRGDRAELSIRWKQGGFIPAYRVVARGSLVEVHIQRR
jgi:hypothetical protein